MEQKSFFIKGLLVVAVMAAALHPTQAFARGGDDHHHRKPGYHHHYPSRGKSAFWLPRNSISISLGGLSFFYGDGVFYRRSGPRYIVVDPPVGAVITSLPAGCQAVAMNGATYYVSQGVYYAHVPSGYVVVDPPMMIVQAPGGRDVFSVDVPRYRGGYVKVIIRRSGDGFIGPRGEYYADFPTIDQLQAFYGLK